MDMLWLVGLNIRNFRILRLGLKIYKNFKKGIDGMRLGRYNLECKEDKEDMVND